MASWRCKSIHCDASVFGLKARALIRKTGAYVVRLMLHLKKKTNKQKKNRPVVTFAEDFQWLFGFHNSGQHVYKLESGSNKS